MAGWQDGDWRNEDLCKFEESNLLNKMGLQVLRSEPSLGSGATVLAILRRRQDRALHGMSRSGVLTQRITTVMHSGTHIDAPAHVVQGTPFMDEVPLPYFFGTGVVVSIPKKKWEVITAKDLENARPKIRPNDIVIVNTGWHKYYGDNQHYYGYSPGFYKEAGEWFVERKVKMCGSDTQALDHPLGTAIGPHGPGRPMGYCQDQRRIRAADGPQGDSRLSGMGAVPQRHSVGGHLRVRKYRRRYRCRHRKARHLRRLPVALEKGRRLHRAPGRHHGSDGQLQDRNRRRRIARRNANYPLADARRYDAPKHFDMRSLRLQGFDVSDSKFAWVGLSHFLPQGGALMDISPLEKIYVVLAGR
jgi:kynurenine formamidase